MFDEYLIHLCCPECKSDLISGDNVLVCKICKTNFEIREKIPVLKCRDLLSGHYIDQINYFEHEMNDRFCRYKLEEWQNSYVKRFLKNFRDLNNKLVLDCGTGSGYLALELAKLGAKVIACDLTLKNLINLRKVAAELNLLNKIIFICCSAEALPFKRGIFDYYISNAVLEHLPKEKEAIAEMSRVCKNTSGLMITAPLSIIYLNPIFIPANIVHDRRIGHLRRYDEKILTNKLKDFKLIKTYYTGHSKKVLKALINHFLKKIIFNELKMEKEDEKKENRVIFASNIICFFKR
ncbi:MAG: methyltransferase domain-containing protein [Patescibacteria group bacterium]|nr:methyltransferase domain-containing protein [Patescibacteria group bacterium]